MDYKKAVENIRLVTSEYLIDNNIKSVVLGVSGGIDSALVAALIKPVCDELKIPLIGRSISISTNSAEEEDRARRTGKAFCTDFKEIDLTDEYFALQDIDDNEGKIENDHLNSIPFKIRMGNIKARLRMIYLYNLASKSNGLVLSTDNFTEYMLGFWTLHGDVGDFGMIQEMYKTDVYGMAEYLADENIDTYSGAEVLLDTIVADATDGLGITNTDLDQILPDWKERHTTTRSGYEEVDTLIKMYLKDGKYPKNKAKSVSDRIKSSDFKRSNPLNIPLEIITHTETFKKRN